MASYAGQRREWPPSERSMARVREQNNATGLIELALLCKLGKRFSESRFNYLDLNSKTVRELKNNRALLCRSALLAAKAVNSSSFVTRTR